MAGAIGFFEALRASVAIGRKYPMRTMGQARDSLALARRELEGGAISGEVYDAVATRYAMAWPMLPEK